ncbi:Carboxysome shell and ethanolamine utilization microcompartment protein CcmL/EutN [Thermoflavimicrobium dichotomicum]|uniref:Carboxysome shell and ethanolamine utilization microcompartment protein CcmL/EutN n=2 Tax=Thermoflavimicrobium dichotomicum TaxID=46223 RepID=A0A1I3U1S9_9BACL|nr:Carboxysome shell and ethanolamine utilization microcompartment protein CcmL/EutN [Thermoflavimicrobium dichotomicum]
MKQQALGLIETVGYTTAVSAADAALKAANVTLIGVERVIGAGKSLGVTIHLSGDVAAVTAAVQAGKEAAERVGKVISAHVIPRAHDEVTDKILTQFLLGQQKAEEVVAKEESESVESQSSLPEVTNKPSSEPKKKKNKGQKET